MSKDGAYDPRAVEPRIYQFWERGGCFHAQPDPARRPYVIDIPLPNVTGSLHLGHALNNTLQDVLIRHHRMRGYNAMWMPGTDHAGIATQAVVEKKLREQENLTRHELGREGLVERIWQWKEQYGGRILEQLRRIGCSCDWQRTRFTLDQVCARAVYEVFFRWFKEGLIYRGTRLVNWDAALQTAVADDEIVHETVRGHLWHYRYPILESGQEQGSGSGEQGSDVAAGAPASRGLPASAVRPAPERATRPGAKLGEDYLVVATTRPETMLGDTAVAVHPADERYRHLIGRYCLLPLMNRPIPIIADEVLVRPEFGTGCVKVTPGHDPNDYDCGQRHKLEFINILTPDGRINDSGGPYAGLTVAEARKSVVADLEALGLMERIEPYETEIGHSDRSKTPIEPMLSEQWFVRMADLCELAMEALRDGRVQFFPERYAKTYLDWLGEKRDWCISRQLWWGHRIPVWSRRMSVRQFRRLLEAGDGAAVAMAAADHNCCVRVVTASAGSLLFSDRQSQQRLRGLPPDEVLTWYICLRDPGRRWPADEPTIARRLERDGFEQDPDVLDTWFSSALWPFSTLGWPDDYGRREATQARGHTGQGAAPAEPEQGSARASPALSDLDYFYPTSTLVTAREIITLWVARMVMTGLHFTRRVPFSHVVIHPNIQDGQGRRMSKSAGNGVDPVDLIDLYGADALRFTLVQMASETQDVRMPVSYLCPHCGGLVPQDSVVPKDKVPAQVQKVACTACKKPFATVWAAAELKRELGVARDTSDRFELGRNFCNKLWQAATGFVLPSLRAGAAVSCVPRPLTPEELELEDRWILSRLAGCIAEVNRRFERYQLNEVAGALYAFFWSDFCDWYVELVKPRLYGERGGQDARGASHGQDARATGPELCEQNRERGRAARLPDHAQSAAVARQVLAWVLDQTLRLLHPVMPFITEALWARLNEAAPQRGIHTIRNVGPPSPTPGTVGPPSPTPRPGGAEPGSPTPDDAGISPALIVATWPAADGWGPCPDVERDMHTLQGVIRTLRDIRAHVNHSRAAAGQASIRRLPKATVRADRDTTALLREHLAVIQRLGGCEELAVGPDVARPPESAGKVLAGVEVYVPLAGLADLEIERARLSRERQRLAGHLRRLEARLANEGFLSNAPPALVQRERARLEELRARLAGIEQNLAALDE